MYEYTHLYEIPRVYSNSLLSSHDYSFKRSTSQKGYKSKGSQSKGPQSKGLQKSDVDVMQHKESSLQFEWITVTSTKT